MIYEATRIKRRAECVSEPFNTFTLTNTHKYEERRRRKRGITSREDEEITNEKRPNKDRIFESAKNIKGDYRFATINRRLNESQK